ncbi:MAG: hypothetical protein H5U17_01250 [Defluviimonas sp.]|nr:hypothetical protein [Defluviimonas sp.]
MRAAGIIGMVGAGVLGACAAPSVPDAAEAARVPVAVEGKAFLAEIGPGPQGVRFTPAGAVPISGMRVSVRRSAVPLDYSEGRVAKQAAALACAAQGRRFDDTAHGRFAGAGVWEFAGACA